MAYEILNPNVLILPRNEPLNLSGQNGEIAMSGQKVYFYNEGWVALN